MVKKTKKSEQIERHEVPMQGVYSNEVGIGYSDTDVVINFGFSTPSYFEPHDEEEVPVARVILSWETADVLLKALKHVWDDHRRPTKTKVGGKVKGK